MMLLPDIAGTQYPYVRLVNFDIGALFAAPTMTCPDRYCSDWELVVGLPWLKLTFAASHAFSFCVQYSRQLRLWQTQAGCLWD